MPRGKSESATPLPETKASPSETPSNRHGSTRMPATCPLERYAQLVADGEVPFPSDLPAAQAAQLEVLVRALLRERLVTYIARQIAWELANESG